MKPLRQAIDDYIRLRRSLGFKLRDMADDLQNFAAFMEQKAASYVTTELAMEWAMQHADHQPSSWAQRLGFVRVFARYWHATDPRTEIPPTGLLPFRPQRARPYLYSQLEIQKLLAAALKLSPRHGLRPWTYHCLFGLLAMAGLRISEALKLEQPDVDLAEGILTIRQTKFGKTRLVPLHTSTRDVMADYARRATDFCAAHPLPVSFSTITAAVWTALRFVEHSMICRGRSACADRRITRVRGFTIFGTDSQSARWCSGIGPTRMSSVACQCCRRSWGTGMWQIPIGTFRLSRN